MPAPADRDETERQETGRSRGATTPTRGETGAPRFVRLDVKQVTPHLAVVEGGAVVYLGNNARKTVAWPQTILLKMLEVPGRGAQAFKEISSVGLQNYNFVRYDETGELITSKLFDSPTDPDLHGRPFEVVEHPEHLRLFLRAKTLDNSPEFEVLIPPKYHRFMEEYVRRKERFRTGIERDYKNTGGTTSRHSVLGVA